MGGVSAMVAAGVVVRSSEVTAVRSLCGVGGNESRIGVDCTDIAPGEELMVIGDEACGFAMAGSECARSKTRVSNETKGSDYSDPYG